MDDDDDDDDDSEDDLIAVYLTMNGLRASLACLGFELTHCESRIAYLVFGLNSMHFRRIDSHAATTAASATTAMSAIISQFS